MKACHCGVLVPYADHCRPWHRGEANPGTAEALMRSRYSAYVVGERGYLLQTWHPTTRPVSLTLDGTRWTRLEVVGTSGGGMLDSEGTVHFRAHHRDGVLEEHSRFVRDRGRWSYLGPL